VVSINKIDYNVLSRGGLVIYPTETLYAIAADYQNIPALVRLARLKGRTFSKPFPLILASVEEVETIACEVLSIARSFIVRYWPGPLTLVLAARVGLHRVLVSSEGGVGLRFSFHPVATGLALALGRAITSTSANLAGQPAVNRLRNLDPAIVAGVDLVLDGDSNSSGLPSTVLDVQKMPVRILRQGVLKI